MILDYVVWCYVSYSILPCKEVNFGQLTNELLQNLFKPQSLRTYVGAEKECEIYLLQLCV